MPRKKHPKKQFRPDDWKAEVAGVRNFIAQMEARKIDEFDHWRRGMLRHYKNRLSFLRANKPRGVK